MRRAPDSAGGTGHTSTAIPSLDGIRAVAVSLVFFAHSGLERIVPGGLGVTIFFVLSGYLITTLLREEHARNGIISFRNFYLRRCLRLMPPLLVVVLAAAVLSSCSVIDGRFSRDGLLAMLFYFGNYHVIFHDFQGIPAGAGVVWSLAVEEHYYLFYPPLAALLLGIGRPRLTALLLCAACAAVFARRCWLVLHGGTEAYINMATDTRIDAILIGCLMGFLQNPWLDRVPASLRLRDVTLLTTCIAVLAATLALRDESFRLTARYTAQSLAIAPLIYYAVARNQTLPFRWLQSTPMVYIGRVSYTIYLIHHLVLLFVARQWPQLGWPAVVLFSAALTMIFAEAVRRFVEQPCVSLRQSLRRAPAATAPLPVSSVTTPL